MFLMKTHRTITRLILTLAEPGAFAILKEGRLLVFASVKGITLQRASFSSDNAEQCCASGAAAWRRAANQAETLHLTDAGEALARRLKAGNDPFGDQHRVLVAEAMSDEKPALPVMINLKENPLLWLHRRHGRNEKPLIDDAAFAAGERFRAEFQRAGMEQRVTIDWSRMGAATEGGRGAEPSETMVAARARVRRALDAVGPDFAGPIIDLVCFHKGLEQLEREQDWPARSGKVVIRFALAALARHYGYANVAKGKAGSSAPHVWIAPAGAGA
jgi:hypothetical protein